jgi:TPR repeat protein
LNDGKIPEQDDEFCREVNALQEKLKEAAKVEFSKYREIDGSKSRIAFNQVSGLFRSIEEFMQVRNELGVARADKLKYAKAAKLLTMLPVKFSEGAVGDEDKIGIVIRNSDDMAFAFDYSENRRFPIAMLEEMANAGDKDAQFAMGTYYSSEGKYTNPSKAVRWFEKAAEQGHAKGQGFLAGAYAEGIGIDRDYQKAEYWAKKSANQDCPTGMLILGHCYSVQDDYENAILWLEKAEKHGHQGVRAYIETIKTLIGGVG